MILESIFYFVKLNIDFEFSCHMHKFTIKNIIIQQSIKLTLFTLCKNINRILNGLSSLLNSDFLLNKIIIVFYSNHSYSQFKPKLHKYIFFF